MKEEIKKRIEAVRRGEVPEGYKLCESAPIPEDWDAKPLSKLSKVLTEPARNREYETLSISAGIGFVNQAEKFGKELSGKQYEKYTVLREGDFAYNKGNSKKYPQGCTYQLVGRDAAAVPNVFECFRMVGVEPSYYAQLFINGFMNHQLARKINHGVRDDGLLNLTEDDFFSTALPVPPLPEQQKIAEILATCDKVIELKQKLIEEKRRQKKWLMEKLLSENNKAEERTLSSLCSFICDGDWIESKDQSESGIRLIQTGNVGVGQYLDKDGRARFISEETFARLNCTDVFVGDILISRLPDPIGRACMVPQLPTRAITAVDCTILRFKNKDIAQFFLQFATSQQYFNKVAILAGGSTRTRISRKEIENLLIPIPSDPMAMKSTTEVLSLMDKDIALLEAELSEWQQKKKALMQLLLTGLVRVKI